MPEIRIDLYTELHNAPEKLRDTERALKGIDDQGGRTDKALGGLWKQFALGQLAADAARKAIGALADFVKDSVKAAIEGEDAQSALNAALSSTGRTVGPLSEHFKKYADELMGMTVYDDEAIKGAQALLLQLTNLDKDGLDAATRGALGLATVFKMDLDSAARAVAQAYEGNFMAISRMIPAVRDAKTDSEKLAAVQDGLAKMFERSKAETGTFGGALKQMKNTFGELKETVGGAITQNDSFKKAIVLAKGAVDKLANSDDFKLWLSIVIDGFVEAVKFVGKFAEGCKDLMENVFGATKANREFTEEQKKLNAALDRARAAGHDVDQVTRAIAEAHEKAKKEINEVGSGLRDSGNAAGSTGRVFSDVLLPAVAATHLKLADMARTIALLVLPKTADLKGLIDQFTPGLIDMSDHFADVPAAAGPAVEQTKNYFDGLFNDIASGFGNTIQSWLSGAMTFKSFMSGLWGDIKNSFFRVVGEMVAKWMVGLIQPLVTSAVATGASITASLGSGLAAIGSGMAGLVTSLISILPAMATAIASAATILAAAAPAIITVGAIALGFFALAKGIGALMSSGGAGAGDGMGRVVERQDQQTSLLTRIFEDVTNNLKPTLWAIAGKEDAQIGRFDKANGYLKTMVATLKNIVPAATGYEGIVNRPTLFLAGERAVERVSIGPASARMGGGGSVTHLTVPIYLGNEKIDERMLRIANNRVEWLDSQYQRSNKHIPARTIGGY